MVVCVRGGGEGGVRGGGGGGVVVVIVVVIHKEGLVWLFWKQFMWYDIDGGEGLCCGGFFLPRLDVDGICIPEHKGGTDSCRSRRGLG